MIELTVVYKFKIEDIAEVITTINDHIYACEVQYQKLAITEDVKSKIVDKIVPLMKSETPAE